MFLHGLREFMVFSTLPIVNPYLPSRDVPEVFVIGASVFPQNDGEYRFEPLPKTSAGKIQKFELRVRAQSAAAFE